MNHIDGVRKIAHGQAALQSLIDHAFMLMHKHFFSMSHYELTVLRWTLLCFYQDARIKVSLLLRERKQRDDGRFYIVTENGETPVGVNPPGTVRHFNASGAKIDAKTFEPGATYKQSTLEGSLAKTAKAGERATTLGTNMYTDEGLGTDGGVGSAITSAVLAHSQIGDKPSASANGKRHGSKERAGKKKSEGSAEQHDVAGELKLLSQLLRPTSGNDSEGKKKGFTLTLFNTDEDEQQYIEKAQKSAQENVIKIDASKRDRREMNKLMGDLSVDSEKKGKSKKSKGQDLLDMMDSVADET